MKNPQYISKHNSNTEFQSIEDLVSFDKNQNNINAAFDLIYKSYDEPDFDCEFLTASTIKDNDESILDLEIEDDYLDDYNDQDWDTNTYDPYEELTYF
jgi:hypothetical protein